MSCITSISFPKVIIYAGHLKLSGSKKDHEEERVEVSDLMSRLMSGDTLSDEDMMLTEKLSYKRPFLPCRILSDSRFINQPGMNIL